jgi:hypothetical protein
VGYEDWIKWIQRHPDLRLFRVRKPNGWEPEAATFGDAFYNALVVSCPRLTRVRISHLESEGFEMITSSCFDLEAFPFQKKRVTLKTLQLLTKDIRKRGLLLRFKPRFQKDHDKEWKAKDLEDILKSLPTLEKISLVFPKSGRFAEEYQIFHPVNLLHPHLVHLVLEFPCLMSSAEFFILNQHFNTLPKDQKKVLKLGIPPKKGSIKKEAKEGESKGEEEALERRQPKNTKIAFNQLMNLAPNTDFRLWNCVLTCLVSVQEMEHLSARCQSETITLASQVTFEFAKELSMSAKDKAMRRLYTGDWIVCPRWLSLNYKLWTLSDVGEFAHEVAANEQEFSIAMTNHILKNQGQLFDMYLFSETNLFLGSNLDDTFNDYIHIDNLIERIGDYSEKYLQKETAKAASSDSEDD